MQVLDAQQRLRDDGRIDTFLDIGHAGTAWERLERSVPVSGYQQA